MHIVLMTDTHPAVSRSAIRGIYLFAFVLAFWPLADLITNTWPFQLGNMQWRYGFMGLLAGFLHTPILGLTLAMIVAYAMRQQKALRVISAISILGAAVLLGVMVLFALDVVQIRSTVPEARLPSYQVGALIAELKHFTSFLALLLLGIGGWKTSAASDPHALTSDAQSTLVMKSDRKASPTNPA